MHHVLQALAQHWHLSASQYWQLHLVCTLTLGPLVGVICLILFTKRPQVASRLPRLVRRTRGGVLYVTPRLPA